MNQFEGVTRLHFDVVVTSTFQNLAVPFDDHELGAQFEVLEQPMDRQTRGNLAVSTVQVHGDGVVGVAHGFSKGGNGESESAKASASR